MGKVGTQNTGKVEHVGFTITWLGKWLAKSCIARCVHGCMLLPVPSLAKLGRAVPKATPTRSALDIVCEQANRQGTWAQTVR